MAPTQRWHKGSDGTKSGDGTQLERGRATADSAQVDTGGLECVANARAAAVPRQLCVALSRLYLGIADGMSIARVWACRYSK